MRDRRAGRGPRLALAALAACVLLAALAATVLAAAGDLTYRDCLADSDAAGCAAAPHAALAGAAGIAVSPDGEDVYVAAVEGDAVSHLRRDPSDGSLTMAGCVADGGAHGCATPAVPSLAGANGVAVSPEGAEVIVTAAGDSGGSGAVTSLARLANGALLYHNCVTIAAGPAGCTETSESLAGAAGVAVGARSGNVYVAATGAVAQLDVDLGAHEDLLFESCIAEEGAHGCAAAPKGSLDRAEGVAVHSVSQLEDDVFVAGIGTGKGESGLVSRLELDPAAGSHLAFGSCISDSEVKGCAEAPEGMLAGAADVAVSSNGRDLYVAAAEADAVIHLRVESDGELVPVECVADAGEHGCAEPAQNALGGAEGVALSPDGTDLYVVAQEANAITHLRRDPSDGKLTYVGCVADGGAHGCAEPAHDSLLETTALTVSPDEGPFGEPVARPGGVDLYTTAFGASAVTHFVREPAVPRLTATVPPSPSPATEPLVTGTAPAGSMVRIYDGECSGAALATGTAAELAEPGIAVSVAPGTTSSLRALATVDGDVVSACSSPPLSYTAAPAPPNFTATVPKSPSTDTRPRIRGTAQPGSVVTLFTTPDCSGPALTSGPAAEFAAPGIEVSVAAGTTASFHARATIGGAVSECSRGSIAYAATEPPPPPPPPPLPPNPPSPPSPPSPPGPTPSRQSGGGQGGGGSASTAAPRLVFRARPSNRRLALGGAARWFDLEVRNRGAAIAADVRVCIAAPRRFLRVRHCVRIGAVRPDDVKRRRVAIGLKPRVARAAQRRFELRLDLLARDLPTQRKRVHVTIGGARPRP